MKKIKSFFFVIITLIALFLSFSTSTVQANHSWGNYHWARTSNPFTLKLGDNLSSGWDPYLTTTSSDWSVSSIFDTTIVTGLTNPRNCRATSGRVELCNYKYGKNGWLGIAQIWLSDTHITRATTKVNDTYFNTPKYNTPAWKNFVMCQEVGHTFGLDHQDENFSNTNLGTCMDYTDDPDGTVKNQLSNEHPNTHDYDELVSIYFHLDGFTSIQSGVQKLLLGSSIIKEAQTSNFENRSEWGKVLKDNRRVALFERDFGGGRKLATFVIWAQE